MNWHRIDAGTPLIPLSNRPSEYDWGCAYAAANPVIIPNHEIWIYYGASNGKHTSWRDGFLALATLRPDAWVGYQPVNSTAPATLRTTCLKYTGGELRIIVDPGEAPIEVSVLADNERILGEGKTLSRQGDDLPITWSEGFALSALKDQSIRFEFTIPSGRLYSFSSQP